MDGGVFIATLIIGIFVFVRDSGSDSEGFSFHCVCCPLPSMCILELPKTDMHAESAKRHHFIMD